MCLVEKFHETSKYFSIQYITCFFLTTAYSYLSVIYRGLAVAKPTILLKGKRWSTVMSYFEPVQRRSNSPLSSPIWLVLASLACMLSDKLGHSFLGHYNIVPPFSEGGEEFRGLMTKLLFVKIWFYSKGLYYIMRQSIEGDEIARQRPLASLDHHGCLRAPQFLMLSLEKIASSYRMVGSIT